jgi:cytochrome oxidase Cu insertion factor (SCO1/SenC/PrrC family)
MNRVWILGLAAILIIALGALTTRKQPVTTTATTTTPETALKNYGPAPELNNTVWLNTEEPLRLADLRGKVTLIDFWTFG